jgi:hypothetical protein
MRTALAIVCSLTVLAVTYLSLSLLLLRPPGANLQNWFLETALFVAESVLVLVVLAGVVSAARLRWVVVAGGLAIMWMGATAVRATVTGPHFEGYAVILGSLLVLQGVLTLSVFLRPLYAVTTQDVTSA